jgi:hypothetical protein
MSYHNQQKFTINNIEWTFSYMSNEMLPDEENVGIADLIMPGKMFDRFAKECGGMIPYYDREQYLDYKGCSDHACYNSDTQIVLMHHLFKKRRKYKLDYNGLDPYWIFHDSCHAENDVYCDDICCISSDNEMQRLIDGAERAAKHGIYMLPETAFKLREAWDPRWRRGPYGESSPAPMDIDAVFKLLDDRGKRIFDEFESVGQPFYYGEQDYLTDNDND